MTHRVIQRSAVLLMSGWLAACGASTPLPTQPSPALPAPTLRAVVDGLTNATAIAGVSVVNFESDAITSANSYALDFGDGESAAPGTVSHVYRTPGTFTATLTVTDAAGRRASTSATVVARTLTFTLRTLSDAASGPVRFDFKNQTGATATGLYTSDPLEGSYTFTARLDKRHLTINLDDLGYFWFDATVPATFGTGSTPWLFTVTSPDRHGGFGVIFNARNVDFVEAP